MKKKIAMALSVALSLAALSGCGQTDDTNNENNTDPVISGVQTSATIMAGEEFDALAGVTASDEEDGDLTSKIHVEAVGLTFTDGKTTPTEPSEYIGYEIIYTVEDSDGATATQYCTLYVKQAAAQLENVFTSDFTAITPKDEDNHNWDFDKNDAEATATLKQGAYVIDVTSMNGMADYQLNLKRSFADLGAGDYEFIVWASSSVATKINLHAMLMDGESETDTLLSEFNKEVGTTVKAIAGKFTLTQDNATVRFRIGIGGEAAQRPEGAFSLAIEKIAIYKTTGVEKQTDLYKKTSFEDAAGFVVSNSGDGATATAGYDEAEQAAKLDVTSYNTAGGVWSVSAKLPFTGATVERGAKYGYEIVLKATNAHTETSEFIVAPVDNVNVEGRAFNTCVIGAGETTVRGTFTAEFSAEAPAIHFQLGKHGNDTMTSNVILIKSVCFYKIEGDKRVDRVAQDKFVLFGKGTSNETDKKYPYDLYNGSDDGAGVPGIGTAYIENGKLVYKIHEGSTQGGQNKLVIGYWENPIDLPANAYYVVTLKIKASAAIGMDVCLHDMDCGGNWDSGLLLRRAHWQNDPVPLTVAEQTLTFTTEVVEKASKCELILEFGSTELAAIEGDVTIEISEISIGVRKVQD